MHKDTDNYIPIECGLHSEYELAIMHKTLCTLYWIDACNVKNNALVIAVDLFNRDKQEFLRVKTTDNIIHEIRLDKIIKLTTGIS